MEISADLTQKVQSYLFNLSYLIIFMWFLTTDIVVEFQEIEYLSPKLVAPFLKLADLIQLGLTTVYTLLYFKIGFKLADYRSKKQKE